MDTPPVTLPSATPRRSRRRRVGLAATVLVLAGAGVGLGSEHLVLSTTDTVSGVRELVVDVDAGNVVLRKGAGPDVTVRTSRYGWTLGGRGTGHRLEAGVLTVEADCAGTFGGCHVEEELTVPSGVAVRVRTDDGGIEAVDLDGARFDAETSAGTVSFSFE